MLNKLFLILFVCLQAFPVSKKVINSDVKITGGTASSSSTTGALVVTGGLGVSGLGNFGDRLSVSSPSSDSAFTISSGAGTLLAGTSQYGMLSFPSFINTVATTEANTYYGQPRTNGAGTIARVSAYFADTASTAGTVTRLINYRGINQTAGTNNAFMADNASFSGDWFINQSGSRASSFGGSLLVADGLVSAPGFGFSAEPTTGFYRSATGRIRGAFVGVNGIDWLNTAGGGTQYGFSRASSLGAGNASLSISNSDNSSGTSHASLNIISGGSSGGDARIYWSNSVAGPEFFMGIDNSDSDKFVLSRDGSNLGTNNVFEVGSNLAFTAVGQLIGKGTATNDSAAAGYIGETIVSDITANTTIGGATNDFRDLTSISLTAGDWLVSATVNYERNGAAITDLQCGISTTSGNSGTGLTAGVTYMQAPVGLDTNNYPCAVGPIRASLSGTTTYYLKGHAQYTVATPNFRAHLLAWRIR